MYRSQVCPARDLDNYEACSQYLQLTAESCALPGRDSVTKTPQCKLLRPHMPPSAPHSTSPLSDTLLPATQQSLRHRSARQPRHLARGALPTPSQHRPAQSPGHGVPCRARPHSCWAGAPKKPGWEPPTQLSGWQARPALPLGEGEAGRQPGLCCGLLCRCPAPPLARLHPPWHLMSRLTPSAVSLGLGRLAHVAC